jgi:CRISPR/Cas system-associated exonuclease Cas4 (RecB family)
MTRPTSSLFLGESLSTLDLLERSMSSDMEDWPIFSYSQFQSWDRCEELWYYAYFRNWIKIRKEAGLNLGSELHLSFKNWYDMAIAKIPKDDRREKVMAYFTERINEAEGTRNADDQLIALNKALRLSMRYFQEFAPHEDAGHRIIATEYHFTVPFKTGNGRNFILQGYIDLLTEYEGRLWVWDHKSMQSQFWSPVQVMMEPQTPLYAAALRELGENIHGVIINMINTYDYKKPVDVPVEKLFRREKAYRSQTELNSIVQEMKFIVDDIIENYETPRRSLRLDCKNCSFQEPCLMKIKGISDEPLLAAEYKQKDKKEVELKLSPAKLMEHA